MEPASQVLPFHAGIQALRIFRDLHGFHSLHALRNYSSAPAGRST
jgi:hypothetical protein